MKIKAMYIKYYIWVFIIVVHLLIMIVFSCYRQHALTTEKLRSAEIAALPPPPPDPLINIANSKSSMYMYR